MLLAGTNNAVFKAATQTMNEKYLNFQSSDASNFSISSACCF